MKLKSKFLEAFKSLGLRWHLTETTFNVLEEYVCMLYGQNTKDVNAARSNMFLKKYSSTSKVIDLALIPPCRSVLYLHTQRGNYVAKIWKSSNVAWHDISDITDHGWFDNREIDWVNTVFPEDIQDILINPDFDIDNTAESDCDDISDEEDKI